MLNEYQEKQYFALLQGCLKTGYWWPMWEWLDEECKLDASSDYWQFARVVGRYRLNNKAHRDAFEWFLSGKDINSDWISGFEHDYSYKINPEVPRPILRNEYEYHLQHGHEQKGEDWSRLIEWADLYGTPEQVLMARVLGRYRLRHDNWGWDCWYYRSYKKSSSRSHHLMFADHGISGGVCDACYEILGPACYYPKLQTWLTAEHNHDHLADLELIHKRRLNPEIHLPQSEVVA